MTLTAPQQHHQLGQHLHPSQDVSSPPQPKWHGQGGEQLHQHPHPTTYQDVGGLPQPHYHCTGMRVEVIAVLASALLGETYGDITTDNTDNVSPWEIEEDTASGSTVITETGGCATAD